MNPRITTLIGILCLMMTGLAMAAEEGSDCDHWTYSGTCGPEHWCDHFPDACGNEQSPIDIVTGDIVRSTALPILDIDYGPTRLSGHNNGHTVQFNAEHRTGVCGDHLVNHDVCYNFINVGEKQYRLLQFHFHTPSEHLIDGAEFPMELHLVHQAGDGSLAVISVFIKEGAGRTELSGLWAQLPEHEEDQTHYGAPVNLRRLLPADRTVYTYDGSLTTPPATEGVKWFVMRKPITMTQEQIDKFKQLFSGDRFPDGNRRPVQPLNDRKVYSYGDTDVLVDILFVLKCEAVESAGDVLTLHNVDEEMFWFSDRPKHLSGSRESADLALFWDIGADSFAVDPPNAVLTIDDGDTVILELLSINIEGASFSFEFRVLYGNLPQVAGSASMIIDATDVDCCGVEISGSCEQCAPPI